MADQPRKKCSDLNAAELKRYVDDFNRRHHASVKLEWGQSSICDQLEDMQDIYDTGVTDDILDEMVVNLSNKLVTLIGSKKPSRRRMDDEEALRVLGAHESRSTIPGAVDIVEADKAAQAAHKQSKRRKAATSPRSAATNANRLAKMMAGRVLSARRAGTTKKDGTPLHMSYVQPLKALVATHPQLMQIAQVREALSA